VKKKKEAEHNWKSGLEATKREWPDRDHHDIPEPEWLKDHEPHSDTEFMGAVFDYATGKDKAKLVKWFARGGPVTLSTAQCMWLRDMLAGDLLPSKKELIELGMPVPGRPRKGDRWRAVLRQARSFYNLWHHNNKKEFRKYTEEMKNISIDSVCELSTDPEFKTWSQDERLREQVLNEWNKKREDYVPKWQAKNQND
jgi:hypothetical protein